MKKILAIIAIAAFLSGCASTKFDKLGIQERTMKVGDFGGIFILYESTTKGFDASGIDIEKENE